MRVFWFRKDLGAVVVTRRDVVEEEEKKTSSSKTLRNELLFFLCAFFWSFYERDFMRILDGVPLFGLDFLSLTKPILSTEIFVRLLLSPPPPKKSGAVFFDAR